MVQVQFLNSGEILTPSDNSPIAVTKTIAEIQDLSKRKGSFSKTITFIGNKETNKIFGHYYDVNLENSSFDRKALTPVILIENGQEILRGNMRLLAITNRSNDANYDNIITYEVSIYNEVADFFTSIQTQELSTLDFTEFDHNYAASAVTASFNNTWVDGYKYTLPYTDDNTYDLSDLRPAIYARQIWDKIFANAGYTYEWSSQDVESIQFSRILMPYNGDELKWLPQEFENFYVEAENLSGQTYNAPGSTISNGQQNSWFPTIAIPNLLNYQVLAPVEIQDNGNNYDDVTSTYTAPIPATGQFVYRTKINCNLKFNLQNALSTAVLGLVGSTPSDPDAPFGWRYSARFQAIDSANNFIGSGVIPLNEVTSSINNPYLLPNGTTQLFDENLNFTITSPNLPIGNTIRVIIFLLVEEITANGANPRWRLQSNPSVLLAVNNQLIVDNLSVQIFPDNNTFGFGAPMSLNKTLQKMKQSNFIKGFLTLFNLYVDIDPLIPKKLIIKRRDAYYDSGNPKDWTNLLAKDLGQTITFASEESGRSKVVKYKDGKSFINKAYQDRFNEVYGQFTYVLDDRNLRGEDIIELPFSPVQLVDSPFGAIVLGIDGFAPKENPMIVYDGGTIQLNNTYSIIDFYQGPNGTNPQGELDIDEYPYVGHFFNNPDVPNLDLNFWIPQALGYIPSSLTANNMFNLHWRRTFNQINNAKVMEAYFNLNELEFANVKLNDSIFVQDGWWNIIEISDYSANLKRPTKVKLIQVDDNIALGSVGIGAFPIVNPITSLPNVDGIPDIPADPSGLFGINLSDLTNAIIRRKNIDEGISNVILGKYNYLPSGTKNNFIGGNGNFVEGDGNTILGDNYVIARDNTIQNQSQLINSDEESKVIGERSTILASRDSKIVGNNSNIVASSENTLIGTNCNIVASEECVIDTPNSLNNSIISSSNSTLDSNEFSLILGGIQNVITGGAPLASQNMILAGNSNTIKGEIQSCSIITGVDNTIEFNSDRCTLMGGFNNFITGSILGSLNSGIMLGEVNSIITCTNTTILGGNNNVLENSNRGAIIASTFSSLEGNDGSAGSLFDSSVNIQLNVGTGGGQVTTIGSMNCDITSDSLPVFHQNIINSNDCDIVTFNTLPFMQSILNSVASQINSDPIATASYIARNSIYNSVIIDLKNCRRTSVINSSATTVNVGQDITVIALDGVTLSSVDNNKIHLGKNTKVYGAINVESFTPTGTADAAGEEGDMRWDDDYVYVKTASGWRRTALSTF